MDPLGKPARLGSGSPSPWSSYDAAKRGGRRPRRPWSCSAPTAISMTGLGPRPGSARLSPPWRASRGRRCGTCSSRPRPWRSWTGSMRSLADCRSIRSCARRWCGSGGSAVVPRKDDDDGHHAKAILLQEVLCWKLAPDWQRWYRKVAGTLRTTVRASSAVESVNSVLRMHQSRHRNLGQGLLDLKRLYWNTRPIVAQGPASRTLPLPIAGPGPAELQFLGDSSSAEMAEAVTPKAWKATFSPRLDKRKVSTR